MHVNMRRIALLKFFMMVFGLSHWAGTRILNPKPLALNPIP